MHEGVDVARNIDGEDSRPITRRAFLKTAAAAGAALSIAGLGSLASASSARAQSQLAGFTPESSALQAEYETILQDVVNAEVAGANSRVLSFHPQLVGTEGNRRSLQYTLDQLASYGLNPQVSTYHIYLSVPQNIEVEQVAPYYRNLLVKELSQQENIEDVVVGYNAYSPAGNVTGELVYVNYGLPEDYEALESLGVDVVGKIVIARYGEEWRGLKPKFAEQRGAIGCILYTDPQDDGYAEGAVYPEGPWRPANSIQRGSIIDLPIRPGDPLTPAEPSLPGTPRLAPEDSESLPRIPTTPLSHGQARYLLQSLGGPEALEEFQGALPFIYRVGPGPAQARLNLDIYYQQVAVNNVITEIPGARYPEQKVIVGAQRDAWAYGANDNSSGTVALLEIARALAELGSRGYRPDRTIVLAGWDGEEYGLLGSTEWVEHFQQELGESAVAYINLDGIAGTEFEVSAVPALDGLLYDSTQTVTEPGTYGSVYEQWASESEDPTAPPEVGRLGSGSDYTAFLDFVGIPCVDLGYEAEGGAYHSAYDNTYSVENFDDPGYVHQAAAARITGVMALRLANADVLPLDYSAYAREVVGYLEELQELQDKAYGGQQVDLSPQIRQAKDWMAATVELRQVAEGLLASDETTARPGIDAINGALLRQERHLIQPVGLPGRPWYKHQVYAPGLDTGYAVQELAAIEDALEARDFATANQYRLLLGDSLRSATADASAATADARALVPQLPYTGGPPPTG